MGALTVAVIIVIIVLVTARGGHKGAPDTSLPRQHQTPMDRAKAVISRKTGHSVSDLRCTHDIDYFCQASHREDFDNPDQPLCWKALDNPGRPLVVLGPMSAYCP